MALGPPLKQLAALICTAVGDHIHTLSVPGPPLAAERGSMLRLTEGVLRCGWVCGEEPGFNGGGTGLRGLHASRLRMTVKGALLLLGVSVLGV